MQAKRERESVRVDGLEFGKVWHTSFCKDAFSTFIGLIKETYVRCQHAQLGRYYSLSLPRPLLPVLHFLHFLPEPLVPQHHLPIMRAKPA
jgi:hypothetical protein